MAAVSRYEEHRFVSGFLGFTQRSLLRATAVTIAMAIGGIVEMIGVAKQRIFCHAAGSAASSFVRVHSSVMGRLGAVATHLW